VPASVLVLTGLPGSGSEAIGADVAKLLGCRVIDDEITDMMCRRMRCSAGEIDRFESSHASFWSRMLNSIVVPMEWSATYDAGYHLFRRDRDYDVLKDVLTRERYLKCLASVVREVCAQGQAVLHGHGSHAVIPASADAVSVFVTASAESRGRRIALDLGMGIEEADKWRKQADAETFSISKHLLGTDLRDMGQFDITVNADRLSTASAAELVFGALQAGAVRQRSAKGVEAAEESVV
jgi:cytidylate kinase